MRAFFRTSRWRSRSPSTRPVTSPATATRASSTSWPTCPTRSTPSSSRSRPITRGQLDQEMQQQMTDAQRSGGGEVEVDEEHQLWPFRGEYWRDELGLLPPAGHEPVREVKANAGSTSDRSRSAPWRSFFRLRPTRRCVGANARPARSARWAPRWPRVGCASPRARSKP